MGHTPNPVNDATETRIPSEEVRRTLTEVIDRAWSGETIIVTRHDRERAVIISPREYERLSALESAAA